MDCEVCPVDHWNVEPVFPAFKFALLPTHMKVFARFTIGNWLTLIVVNDVALHPLASVPVTVYKVVTVGEARTYLRKKFAR